MFSRIEFILTETFISLRRHPAMAMAAVFCVAAALFVSGIVGLTLLNAHHLVKKTMERVSFVVFFNTDATRHETWKAYKDIRELDGITGSHFVAKEKAWDRFKKENPQLAEDVGHNPLPDSIELKAADVKAIPELKSIIKERWPDVISEVRSDEKVTGFLSDTRMVIGRIGPLLGILLAVVSLIIIHHTIELTLYARRKEIFIMSMVGATPGAIASPFVLEGITYGLIGGGVALGTLAVMYDGFAGWLKGEVGASVMNDPVMLQHGALAILVAGVALGFIGSMVSATKYLYRPRSKVTNA
jgi:cell division transport system permease protein